MGAYSAAEHFSRLLAKALLQSVIEGLVNLPKCLDIHADCRGTLHVGFDEFTEDRAGLSADVFQELLLAGAFGQKPLNLRVKGI